MSIILKGVDLPKCSNEDCIVVIRHDKAEVWQTGYKERTVEAIQIPTPHGRLIDADKFIDDLKYDADMDMTRFITDGDEEARYDAECKENCISFIESSATPTILESEE